MKIGHLTLILLMIVSSCDQGEISDQCAYLDALDKEMLDKIDEIKVKYREQEEFIRRFNDAQVFWTQYKDRQVRALYPLKKGMYSDKYGEEYSQCKCAEWARLTKVRLEEISAWTDGSAYHSECPTSINQ